MSTYKNLKYNHLATADQGALADSALQTVTENHVTTHQAALTIAESQVTGLTAALAAKADASSLATVATTGAYSDLSGTPTVVSTFTNDANYATTTDVTTAINNLIGAAPGTLDTLEEIATSINNDATVYNTLNSAITNKLDASAVSTFGLSLIDDADATAARTTLNVDLAGTDNSTDVTLAAGSKTFVSLSGQELTIGSVPVADITGLGTMATETAADYVLGSTISTFGASLVDDADASAARTTLGLGTVATTDSTDYATAAQGTKADTATQPADIANMVETTDSINVLADVDTATAAPTDGQLLSWDNANSKWVPADAAIQGLTFDTAIKTTAFTAVSMKGYFVDTATTGAVTVTLPASPTVGDEVHVIDVAANADTANITIARNGNRIASLTEDMTVATAGAAFKLIWSGSSTFGWVLMNK